MDSDKKKALELALGKIEKDFGKGSLMRLGDKPDEKIPVIPTGALSLDIALGIGGVPRGRIIEILLFQEQILHYLAEKLADYQYQHLLRQHRLDQVHVLHQ